MATTEWGVYFGDCWANLVSESHGGFYCEVELDDYTIALQKDKNEKAAVEKTLLELATVIEKLTTVKNRLHAELAHRFGP